MWLEILFAVNSNYEVVTEVQTIMAVGWIFGGVILLALLLTISCVITKNYLYKKKGKTKVILPLKATFSGNLQ